MKVTFKTQELLKKLREEVRLIPSASTIPAFQSILFTASKEDEKVDITASDGNRTLRFSFYDLVLNSPCSIEKSGSLLLPGRELLDIVKLSGDEITFESKSNVKASVVLDGTKYNLQGIDPSVFHPFTNKGETTSVSISATKLHELIRRTTYATSKSETKPILMGVNIVLSETGTVARATDGLRLARVESNASAQERFDITIPSASLELLDSLVPDDDDEEVELKVGSTAFVAKWCDGDAEFSTIGLDGSYPDTDRIMPTQFREILKTNRQELESKLSRANVIARNRHDGLVKVTVSGEKLHLYAEAPGCGDTDSSIDIKRTSNQEWVLGANILFLLDAIKKLQDDEIEIGLNGMKQPLVLQDSGSIALVSPLLIPQPETEEKSA